MHLEAGLVAFDGGQLGQPLPDDLELPGGQDAGQREVPVRVQPGAF